MALHEIPDDGWPHSASSECGCGVKLTTSRTRRVYAHCDMRPVRSVEQWNALIEEFQREGGGRR